MSSIDSFFDALEDEDVPQPWTTRGRSPSGRPGCCSRCSATTGGSGPSRCRRPPSSALLAEFGVSDSAARAALSRLTRNGLLVTSRSGRRTYVQLSRPRRRRPRRRRAAHLLLRRDPGAVGRHVVAGRVLHPRGAPLGPRRAAQGAALARLRAALRRPVGLPRDHAGEVMARLKELGITTATAFRATALPAVPRRRRDGAADGAGSALVTADIPARAWDLSGLRDRYEEFTSSPACCATRRRRARSASPTPWSRGPG